MTAQRHAESPRVLEALLDKRSDPSTRRVLADYRLERGQNPGRLGVELWVADAADAHAVDADADAHAADAHADAPDDAHADDVDADADVPDDTDAADAHADDAHTDAHVVDAAIRHSLHNLLTGELDMKDGLKVIQVPGRFGYSVTLVGWVRRVNGDELELLNAVTVARTGTYRLDGIQRLASEGPGKRGYDVTEPAKLPEELHRLLVRRSLPANEAAWQDYCPKPKGWLGE